jgi:hypothetical protein
MTISMLIYIVAFLVIILLVWMMVIEHRLKNIFAGTKAKNLEDVMVQINKQITEIRQSQEQINEHLKKVDDRLNKSIRRIETIRFNPFEDAGSNQSFAMAFLNDEGNGVVISSLYARERMSIFAKPINNGKSDFELSAEEKEVLNKAK